MSAGEIPVVLLLLLPGFVAVQVFNWVSHKRRLSDFETLLWMLISSFALLAPTATIWHELDDTVPSLGRLVKDPTTLPMRVAGVLYGLAVLGGWLAGYLDRSRILEQVLLEIGVDLTRRYDAWHLAFRDAYYVIVYLKSGAMIYGWPKMNTTSREWDVAEVYLTDTGTWDSDAERWVKQEGIAGVWVDAASIERIEFTAEPENEAP
jgi:hypothetical protein